MARKQGRLTLKRSTRSKTAARPAAGRPKKKTKKTKKATAAKKGKKAAVTTDRRLRTVPPPLTHVAKYGWYGPAW